MTAQIAILNRVGVALAADSALSVRNLASSESKVYNSVDKLFAMSNTEPVGIMINGTAEFLGVPAETLIKTYRDSPFGRPHATLEAHAASFFEYLRKTMPADSSQALEFAADLIVQRLLGLKRHAEDEFETSAEKGPTELDFATFVDQHCRRFLAEGLAEARRRPALKNITTNNLPLGLDKLARPAIAQTLGEGLLDLETEVTELVTLMLMRDISTGVGIKFVFAGFGTDQLFPAVYAAECDGPLVGTHKIRVTDDECISMKSPALIKPFAQREMVTRFTDGVDDAYSDFIENLLARAISRFSDHALERAGAVVPDAMRAELADLLDQYAEEIRDAAERFRIEAFRKNVLEVIQFMPKSDLAELAESLVNLQSIKRRVSSQRETVGGPIDVAVVSKNDGFVWIKRKRYFDPALNSRFFIKERQRLDSRHSEVSNDQGRDA